VQEGIFFGAEKQYLLNVLAVMHPAMIAFAINVGRPDRGKVLTESAL